MKKKVFTKFLFASLVSLSSNLYSSDLIFELNSCRFQQETIDIKADTRTDFVNITNIISPSEDADWVSLFNPFQIIDESAGIIKARSYFSGVLKNGGVASGDAYEGSKDIFLELTINLSANSVFTAIKLSEKAGRDWKSVKNVRLVLSDFGYGNAKISNGAMIDGFLYDSCSSRIIKDYEQEDEERENKKILAKLQMEKLELEKLKLQTEIENTKYSTVVNTKPVIFGSGTGFRFNEEGYIATNYHVIHGCTEITAQNESLQIVVTDPINDLAILKSSFSSDFFLSLSEETAIKGEDIYVVGYPFGKGLSAMSKTTKGIVSSLQGIQNSYNQFQMDAPIQPGNSGGPIVNSNGHLKGIAVSTADMQLIFEAYGAIPQNVNFGIKVDILKNILDANEIKYEVNTNSLWDYFMSDSQAEALRKVDKSTVYLECWAQPDSEIGESLNSIRLLKSKNLK
ncbi:serine protease [Gammaproteobacteria bacterium]|jgi:S1-C subfamily serine protease|nr:serine protease [Gammaproteobacteria bacterium]MDB9908048.1 serine protease [Gammaproteobacteria bacterium]|tara:strand:- start:328 stop:1692 length:1365 start_codon:yes stop_codon:yes gene_type:complete